MDSIKSAFRINIYKPGLTGLIILFSVLLACELAGQPVNKIKDEDKQEPWSVAPVSIDGKVLFYVRGISSFPAEIRADTIKKRIRRAASDSAFKPDSIFIRPGEESVSIYLGSNYLMDVYDPDVESEGINKSTFAGLIKSKIKTAILSYRHDRTGQVLIRRSLYAGGSLLLMILVLVLFLRIFRKINLFVYKKLQLSIETVEDRSYKLIRSAQLWSILNIFFRTVKVILIIIILFVGLQYIFKLFPWTFNITVTTVNLILNPLNFLLKGFMGFLPDLFFLVVIYLVTRYLLKLTKLFFKGIQNEAIAIRNFYPDWAMPTYRIFKLLVTVLAIIIAFPYIPGSGSDAFKGISVFLGVLFSLGSTSFIGNVIAGYSITYRRLFKKGDRIQVGDIIGFVEEQTVQVTRLRSHKNEEIIIPNSLLINSNIVNYSARAGEKGLIVHTSVGIGYETPWRQVDAMLLVAAARTEGIRSDPPPFVLKRSLSDFAIDYEINAYCTDVTGINELYNRLHQNILDVFNENNVQIMTPNYVLDPATPKIVPENQWDPPLLKKMKGNPDRK